MVVVRNRFSKHKKAEKKPEIPSEITQHIEWLEQQTAHTLAQVKILSAELHSIQNGLQKFLNDYYEEVGKYFLNLEKIDQQIMHAANIPPANSNKIDGNPEEEVVEGAGGKDFMAQESSRLYRKLVKYCHPDTAPVSNAAKIFIEANEAYRKHDLCNLILLEQGIIESKYFSGESPVQKLERLEKKYQLAVHEKGELIKKKYELVDSPAYMLWQKVVEAKAAGDDMVERIKQSVLKEIRDRELLIK